MLFRSVPYDRFRDRVIFPIADLRGRAVAFGGRTLEKDAQPKYLNSPETTLFHKGATLYNIATARAAAHKGAQIPWDDLNAERSYGQRGFRRYGQTKLANILFTAELARRLEGSGVIANCFHPGVVATGFNRNNSVFMRTAMAAIRPFSRSPEKGAETLVWLVDSEEAGRENGGYFVDCKREQPEPAARDSDAARRLWEITEQQVTAHA